MADSASDTANPIIVSETINVPIEGDITPTEAAKIMRQIARVSGALVANLTRYAALTKREGIAGIEHPITQSVMQCAAQAGIAAVNLEGPSKVLPGGSDGLRMMPSRGGRA